MDLAASTRYRDASGATYPCSEPLAFSIHVCHEPNLTICQIFGIDRRREWRASAVTHLVVAATASQQLTIERHGLSAAYLPTA